MTIPTTKTHFQRQKDPFLFFPTVTKGSPSPLTIGLLLLDQRGSDGLVCGVLLRQALEAGHEGKVVAVALRRGAAPPARVPAVAARVGAPAGPPVVGVFGQQVGAGLGAGRPGGDGYLDHLGPLHCLEEMRLTFTTTA